MAKSRNQTKQSEVKFDDGLTIVVRGVPSTALQPALLKGRTAEVPLGADGRPNRMDQAYQMERQIDAFQPALRYNMVMMLLGIQDIIIPPKPEGEEEWYVGIDEQEFVQDALAMEYEIDTPAKARYVWCVLYLGEEDIALVLEKITELSGSVSEKKSRKR